MQLAKSVYLDTNVFSMISEQEQENSVRRYFDEKQIAVLCSFENVLETLRAPKAEAIKRISVIKRVTGRYSNPGPAYYSTLELLSSIKRFRPDWVRIKPDQFSINEGLRERQIIWKKLRNKDAYSFYISHLEKLSPTIDEFMQRSKRFIRNQKEVRRYIKDVTTTSYKVVSQDEKLSRLIENTPDEERYWRLMAVDRYWLEYYNGDITNETLFWLNFFIRWDKIERDDWCVFWLSELQEKEIPHKVLRFIASYYQFDLPVTNGNALDSLHATYLPYCDIFYTCDRGFFRILQMLRDRFTIPLGQPILIDRASRNILAELGRAFA